MESSSLHMVLNRKYFFLYSIFLVVIKCNLNPFSLKQILAFLIFPLTENKENVNMYIIVYTEREEVVERMVRGKVM